VKRRPLVVTEALVKRTIPLKRAVIFRPAPGGFAGAPQPNTEDERKVDAAIRRLALRFDLSLLLSGDRRFTRQLADEFVEEMLKVADAEGLDRSALARRIVTLGPSIKRSASVFVDRLRYGLQVSRKAP
jgi:hypothetical protein